MLSKHRKERLLEKVAAKSPKALARVAKKLAKLKAKLDKEGLSKAKKIGIQGKIDILRLRNPEFKPKRMIGFGERKPEIKPITPGDSRPIGFRKEAMRKELKNALKRGGVLDL